MFEPLAARLDIDETLSEDLSEGTGTDKLLIYPPEREFPRRPLDTLLLIVRTAGDIEYPGTIGASPGNIASGTDSPIELQIVADGQLVTLFEIQGTSRTDLEPTFSIIYIVPPIVPFSKRDNAADGMTLRLKGKDWWMPSDLFLFGARRRGARLVDFYPLCHAPLWQAGPFLPSSTTGTAEMKLPVYDEWLSDADAGITLEAMKKLIAGQDELRRRINALYEELQHRERYCHTSVPASPPCLSTAEQKPANGRSKNRPLGHDRLGARSPDSWRGSRRFGP